MNERIPLAAGLLTAQAAYVGSWAGLFPRTFDLGYHLAHLHELSSAVDRVGEVAALGAGVVLALLVLAPTWATAPMASTEVAR